MCLTELQLDGLVGPTHNYAGLSAGNVASTSNRGDESHPRQAALQGLEKMAFVAGLGVEQAVLPPHHRPDINALRLVGFHGSDEAILAEAHREDPLLLAQACSGSAMWAANAATVSPSVDTSDGRVHLTPANLRSKFHRAIEPTQTANLLRAIFPDRNTFAIHPALPGADQYGDEGAANHTRLWSPEGVVHLFVYGRVARDDHAPAPKRFPARQTAEASKAIARLHGVQHDLHVQQHPDVIDAGVFHNDVISVGTANTLLVHEAAFVDTPATLEELRRRLGADFTPLVVTYDALTVEEAVQTYLFNSQLLETPRGLELVAPMEAGAHPPTRRVIDDWVETDTPIAAANFIDVRESMRNGGGPACLRLRVPLTGAELESVHVGVRWSATLHDRLSKWVTRWYPETLLPPELADPHLLTTSRDALQDLTDLLGLGSIYPFQR